MAPLVSHMPATLTTHARLICAKKCTISRLEGRGHCLFEGRYPNYRFLFSGFPPLSYSLTPPPPPFFFREFPTTAPYNQSFSMQKYNTKVTPILPQSILCNEYHVFSTTAVDSHSVPKCPPPPPQMSFE